VVETKEAYQPTLFPDALPASSSAIMMDFQLIRNILTAGDFSFDATP